VTRKQGKTIRREKNENIKTTLEALKIIYKNS